MKKKERCRYCGAVISGGTSCSNCKAKLQLIRKIQKMVRNYKETHPKG